MSWVLFLKEDESEGRKGDSFTDDTTSHHLGIALRGKISGECDR